MYVWKRFLLSLPAAFATFFLSSIFQSLFRSYSIFFNRSHYQENAMHSQRLNLLIFFLSACKACLIYISFYPRHTYTSFFFYFEWNFPYYIFFVLLLVFVLCNTHSNNSWMVHTTKHLFDGTKLMASWH